MIQRQIVMYVIGLVVAGIALDQVFKRLGFAGIFPSKSDREANQVKDKVYTEMFVKESKAPQEIMSAPYFKIDFWKPYPQSKLLASQMAQKFANDINNSWGSWYWPNDDESRIYSVFRQLKNRAQISQVAEKYYQTFGKDLASDLAANFSRPELVNIQEIVEDYA